VQRHLESPIARGLLAADFADGDTLAIRADMDAIRIEIEVVSREADDAAEDRTQAAAAAMAPPA